MATKYRIVYEQINKRERRTRPKGLLRYTIYSTLCVLIVVICLCTPVRTRFYELFLPGDPAVTAGAFREFCVAMDRGEALSNALDQFCETVMG